MNLTGPLERVLRALLADTTGRHYGYQLMKNASIQSGTLYPMLARLEEQGLVTSDWGPAGTPGRPARRYYQLTGEGVRAARLELAHASLHAAPGRPGPRPAPRSAQ